MSRSLFAAASLLALTIATGASAADLPRKTVAPIMTVPAFTWTGFYVGLNTGYAWTRADQTLVVPPGSNIAPPFAATAVAMGNRSTGDFGGFTGGMTAGYNYQIGRIVLGVEGDINFFSAKKTGSDIRPVGVGLGNAAIEDRVKVGDYLATARLRLGYAFDRTLVYVTGGAAFTEFKFARDLGFSVDGCGFFCHQGSGSKLAVGYAVGGGVEHAFTNNWTVKAEYIYAGFDQKIEFRTLSKANVTQSLDQQSQLGGMHIARVGVNYKF